MSERNLTMMTDLYQLTMMYGHFMRNAKEEAVFDLFFREPTGNSSYAIVAGLEQAIEYIRDLRLASFLAGIFGVLERFFFYRRLICHPGGNAGISWRAANPRKSAYYAGAAGGNGAVDHCKSPNLDCDKSQPCLLCGGRKWHRYGIRAAQSTGTGCWHLWGQGGDDWRLCGYFQCFDGQDV